MFCKNCGKKIENGGNLCSDCLAKNKKPEKQGNKFYNLLFCGRIGRVKYFLYLFYLLISIIFPLSIMIELEFFVFESIFYISPIFIVLSIPIIAKRLRDLNFSGYFSIPIGIIGLLGGNFLIFEIIISLVNLILLFKKGTEGMNKYGWPQTNSKTNLWIFGIILGMSILSILSFTIIPFL